jgi:uroporphyrinogen-III synthase
MTEQSKTSLFLVTRPALQAERFGQALTARFGSLVEVIYSPLLTPRLLDRKLPKQMFEGVIFSSQTGVQAFAQMGARDKLAKGAIAWCVGDQTAQEAEKLGLKAISAAGDGQDLVDLILRNRGRGPLIHLRGADQRGNLAQMLTNCGTKTTALVVYSQDPQPLTHEACIALSGTETVYLPLFSPRSAQIAVQEYQKLKDPAPVVIAALSSSVALECGGFGGARLHIAARPDLAAMVDVLADLVTQKDRP